MSSPSPERSRARKLAGYAGQAALLVGIAWAGRKLVASGMLATMAHASPLLLVAAFGAAATANLMAAGRWWSLAPAGHGYGRLFRINMESNFWAQIVPGGVAADGYRIIALHKRGADPHHTAASVMLERALGMVALLLVCGPALGIGAQWLSTKLLVSLSALAGGLLLMIVGATIGALWAPVRRGRLLWLPGKLRSACAGLEDAFSGYRDQPQRLGKALAFGFAYHAAFLAAYALIGQSMGLHLSIGRWFIAVPLASLAATLPLNAWGIGVREGAAVLLLVALGATPGQAGAVSIGMVGLQLAVGCSGGVSQLFRRRAVAAAA